MGWSMSKEKIDRILEAEKDRSIRDYRLLCRQLEAMNREAESGLKVMQSLRKRVK